MDDNKEKKQDLEEWLTIEQVKRLCPACAQKLKAQGITKIKKEVFFNSKRKQLLDSDKQGE